MSEAKTLTLTDFLLARIAEDGAWASEKWLDSPHRQRFDYVSDCDCGEDHATGTYLAVRLAFIAAESNAKRRIIRAWSGIPSGDDDPYSRQARETADHVFRCLALPYADHPDYRREWRL